MDPSLISDPREAKWVAETSQLLDRQLEIEDEIPPVSIFQVPETITSKKPEAYKPQQIGFGPYHHFQPGPYSKMQHQKLLSLPRVLKDHEIPDFRHNVLDKVEKLVPVIRACYETFLRDDDVTMAWVFAIDGLFLLDLFRTYDRGNPVNKRLLLLAQDIMMVENQIPFMVLKEINQALHSSSSDNFSPSIFRSFCEINSPLELCSRLQAPSSVQHLLHYMYFSIINNRPRPPAPSPPSPSPSPSPPSTHDNLPVVPIQQSLDIASVVETVIDLTHLIEKVPDKEIAQLYEQTITSLPEFSTTKTTIPSASKLVARAGFRFQDLPQDEGIQHININGRSFYLPRITLNRDSEVILRNLVAYETLIMLDSDSDDYHPLITEYMGLMCGLIVNVEDVKLLKKENIIKGDLGEDEIVKIFVEMSGGCMLSLKSKEKSKLQEKIDEVNKVYESRPMMKMEYLLFEKPANWVRVGLTRIGSFVGGTWKILAFMVSIVTVFMLTYQAYCDVYGCEKNNLKLLLPYASS
ncbi:hypothetical protein SSX86_000009 [Deinandra increscens subsp. villosa]|uniref:Uncharacterized protein n=1 Tax=Deinandra increscens subsp. villosa TaxID=3103831 RepID=A0AAP0DY88_9ASTR